MEKKSKIYRLLWTTITAVNMSLAFIYIWALLEVAAFGAICISIVDAIMMIPISISFWFNAKKIVTWNSN